MKRKKSKKYNPFRKAKTFKQAWRIGGTRKAQCAMGFKSMCK